MWQSDGEFTALDTVYQNNLMLENNEKNIFIPYYDGSVHTARALFMSCDTVSKRNRRGCQSVGNPHKVSASWNST